MRNRFFIESPLIPGEIVRLTGEELHHAVRVARCRDGESVELFNQDAVNATAVIRALASDHAELTVMAIEPSREPARSIELAVALIHPDRFELVLQKGCELGVSRFIPMSTARTEVRAERVAGRLQRWKKIILEATKQSGRSRCAAITPVVPLAQALSVEGIKVLFDAEAGGDAVVSPTAGVRLFIGPEGGWSDEELRLARDAGCLMRSLGPRRLRAETAAIAAVVLAASEGGDLSQGVSKR
ncbi:MAG TPA: RsmE family RNA methyltransferase [Thermoanaerobaculia bacterium]|nr:RsmE family RNA methyltransferase [Thermoanaerobaculia bacterium]